MIQRLLIQITLMIKDKEVYGEKGTVYCNASKVLPRNPMPVLYVLDRASSTNPKLNLSFFFFLTSYILL